jgi:hypothetical protein
VHDVTFTHLNTNEPFEIFDVMGKKMMIGEAQTATLTLEVSSWNEGIYVFHQGQKTIRFIKGR